MLGAKTFLSDRQCSLIQGYCFLMFALCFSKGCQIVQGFRCLGMLLPKDTFAQRECSAVKQFRLRVPSLGTVEIGQPGEWMSGVGMIGTQSLFTNAHGSLEEWLGLLAPPLLIIEERQI